jgi:hypothetical protein
VDEHRYRLYDINATGSSFPEATEFSRAATIAKITSKHIYRVNRQMVENISATRGFNSDASWSDALLSVVEQTR